MRGKTRRGIAVAAIAAGSVLGVASIAGANSGEVTVTQTCTNGVVKGSAQVVLHHNVTPDHRVEVLVTLPGAPGNINNGHYGTDKGPIWSWSWTGNKSGSVTLNIYRPDGTLENHASASVSQIGGCSPTTTAQPTTTIPEVTTTIPDVTTTIPDVTTTIPDTTTVPATVTTTGGVPPTTKVCPLHGVCAPHIAAPPAPPATDLPKTGSSSLPLGLVGIASVLAGVVALLPNRKKSHA